MSGERPYRDEDWLEARVREGRWPDEIAAICDVTPQTIERWIQRHPVRPYQDRAWLERQAEAYVSERAIAEWCCVTVDTIRRWMRRLDVDHPGLVPAPVMRSYLERRFVEPAEFENKRMIELLNRRYLTRVTSARIAQAVDCTPSYVRSVTGRGGGILMNAMDYAAFSGSESVPDDVDSEVRSRDDSACRRCGTENDSLELHHVIPGRSEPDNLATLCRECHEAAHGGDFYAPGFAYETSEEFWDRWLDG